MFHLDQTFGPTPPRVLIEAPHAAHRRAHYDAVAASLQGALPDDLHMFFHVNTDVGSGELAVAVAEHLAAAGVGVRVIRCLLPRTLVDTNRTLQAATSRMTASIPTYVTDDDDRALLASLHRAYEAVVDQAMADIVGAGGLALLPHTYAPRTVGIRSVGPDIVERLREVYAVFETWPVRAEIDLIDTDPDGHHLGVPGIASALQEGLGGIGLTMARNDTYCLHPATQGARYAAMYPGQTVSLEVRRDLVARWDPFVEMDVDAEAVVRIGGVIAKALLPAV